LNRAFLTETFQDKDFSSQIAHSRFADGDDFPLAQMYAGARTLRIADGPDEVHLRTVGRRELRRYASF
jgi:hypothetical protein